MRTTTTTSGAEGGERESEREKAKEGGGETGAKQKIKPSEEDRIRRRGTQRMKRSTAQKSV